ncbi:hypothetical protein CPEBRM1_ABPJDJAI_00473 [Companilactobacillus paralimentarius]|uniref:hypothetical protein n=1 Tax=Companilactobacillus paralimentarius TaxID=83526 RepID=UPI00384E4C68
MADKMIALRLDKDLYDRIAEDAGRENRSVNNYIVTKLSIVRFYVYYYSMSGINIANYLF